MMNFYWVQNNFDPLLETRKVLCEPFYIIKGHRHGQKNSPKGAPGVLLGCSWGAPGVR